MSRNLKFNFNSKEEDISFTPETFEELKNLFLDLYNEKPSKEIYFKYIEEDKEIFLSNENYENFKINENINTIFVSNNLNNNFSNVKVESEYPTGNNRSYTLGETPNPEDSSIININIVNPYQNNKIEEEKKEEIKIEKINEKLEKDNEQLRKKNIELNKDKKQLNELIKKYEEDLKKKEVEYKKEKEELKKKIK